MEVCVAARGSRWKSVEVDMDGDGKSMEVQWIEVGRSIY